MQRVSGATPPLKRWLAITLWLGAASFVTIPAEAQFNGSHTLGDFGVESGTQPAPGFYAALFYYHYGSDTIKDAKGNTLSLSPDAPGSLSINSPAPFFWYVSKTKFLGANVGTVLVIPWANSTLDAPALGLDSQTDTSLSDLFIRPLDLGWHEKKADFVAGLDIYAPTGTYMLGGSENTGKGMWTYEPFVGATFYLDDKKSWSFATNAFYEFHGTKRDTDIKVGQLLTLEGGLGKSYLGGGLILGMAYYAQWKITEDSLGTFALPGGGTIDPTLHNKNRVYGLGPDITLPVATKKKLFALVNIRYLWEMGARTKTQGQSLIVTVTFPVPSVKLN